MISTPTICEICKSSLGEYFWYCKNCEKFLCYDCLPRHVEHDLIALEYVTFGKSKLVPICSFGGGPSTRNWETIPLNELIHNSKVCIHAIESLKDKRAIFLCGECNKLVCLDCLKYHEEHFPQHYILLNDDKTLRMLYYESYPTYNVNVTTYGPNSAHEGECVTLTVKIQNQSSKHLRDVNISLINISKDRKIDPNPISKDWYIELHYPSRVLLELNKNISIIEPYETKKITFEVRIPTKKETTLPINDPFIIYTGLIFTDILNLSESMYGPDLKIKLIKN